MFVQGLEMLYWMKLLSETEQYFKMEIIQNTKKINLLHSGNIIFT